jgi:hypothetical protein
LLNGWEPSFASAAVNLDQAWFMKIALCFPLESMTPSDLAMKSCTLKISLFILFAGLFGSLPALAGAYEAGQTVAPFKATDQHEKAFTFDPMGTRFLLISHDMEAGKSANSVLDEAGSAKLAESKVVYVANIVGMPSIGRLFAFPKMRKYSHQIILGDDADLISKFPVQAGKVTVLLLTGGKITSIRFWSPATEALAGFLK